MDLAGDLPGGMDADFEEGAGVLRLFRQGGVGLSGELKGEGPGVGVRVLS
jgi:hypothetical protein